MHVFREMCCLRGAVYAGFVMIQSGATTTGREVAIPLRATCPPLCHPCRGLRPGPNSNIFGLGIWRPFTEYQRP